MSYTERRSTDHTDGLTPPHSVAAVATPEQEIGRKTLPDFAMSTQRGTLQTSGELLPVAEDECQAIARERGSIVVGMLPFDPDEKSLLCVPERFTWSSRYPAIQATSEAARPTSVIGYDSQLYRDAVTSAVTRIHEGSLEKVVLSRALELVYEAHALKPGAVYRNLLAQNPSAYVFTVRDPSTGEYVMGASPELVVGVHDGKCSTHPLAGSASRQIASGPTEDAQAGEALLKSAKDRAEHATVVQDITARLEPLCESLNVPPVPTLVATPQLWHLGTPMSGKLKQGITALDAARAIHPTPAICGMPRSAALEIIRELEPYERGYYGGLVGWMDADGNGEWALNLRSGRVGARRATLCAGAGIVDGSTAGGEHHETAIKLSTFLAALGLRLEDVDDLAR
ncbi:isochorismate synthase MenF [Kocuria sp. TGY1127_2]|uniref:isochorismate synthase n=1 Tax=Kocuria sp. TGY1127_2 TaxID=2711328 RepID=UPI0015B9FC1B|nr:isochorismate synthase [Kocuria sp. TGY1127_2]